MIANRRIKSARSVVAAIFLTAFCVLNSQTFAASHQRAAIVAPTIPPDTMPSPPAQPFDMRGIQLGMSLDDFKKLAPLDRGGRGVHDITLECSAQPMSILGFENYDALITPIAAAGVQACQWRAKRDDFDGDRIMYTNDEALSIALGNTAIYPVFYFVPDTTFTLRLFRIHGAASHDFWNDLYGPLVTKYGQPKLDNTPLQNGFGAQFQKLVATWDNGTSTIDMEQYCSTGRPEFFCVDYTHKELFQRFRDLVASSKPPPRL